MKSKKINYKILYISIIILGTLFILISCFHSNMWFDESYSIAIAKHSFKEIWQIGSHDVHPVLYYIMIRIVMLITNNSIVCVRLFSCVPLILMSILGYSFIRKEFGNKAGLIFTFFSLFFPTLLTYAGEIRMYTWAMLFVTMMFVYAYKTMNNYNVREALSDDNNIMYENKIKSKNTLLKYWIIFSIFSLASAYTHYYALVVAAIINVGMFIYFIIAYTKSSKNDTSNYDDIKNDNKKSEKINSENIRNDSKEIIILKDRKTYKFNLISSIVSAVVQIILYLPWLFVFISQTKVVSKGFWIKFPTPLNVIEFIYTGNIGEGSVPKYLSIPFSLISIAFLVYLIVKNWKRISIKTKFPKTKEMPGTRTTINTTAIITTKVIALIWAAIILIMCLASLIMKQSVFYQRYLFTLMGLFLIGFSILLSGENKKIIATYCLCILIISTILNINLINTNYDYTNKEPMTYLKSELQQNDWILISDQDYSGYICVATLLNDFSKVINYDVNNWNIKEAYKCYGDTILNLDEINGIKGRMWIISAINSNIPNEVTEKFNAEIIDSKEFKTKYKGFEYKFTLININ